MQRSFCGEGFPDHAISAVTGPLLHFPLPLFFFDIPLDEKGTPELSACTKYPFFAFSYSFSAASAWGNFYDSDHLHQLFAGSWRAVAQAFSDPAVSGAVLAYELLNEPTSGDVWRHPLDVVNGHAVDSNYLAPIYEKVHHAVREVDEDTIIMYEPGVVGASLPFGSTGFAMGPGGRQYDDRQAFAYHIYCPSWPWGPPALLPLCKPLILGSTWDRLLRDSARIGGGRFLTEFGAVGHDADSLELLRVVLNKADTRGQSWAYWQFKVRAAVPAAARSRRLVTGAPCAGLPGHHDTKRCHGDVLQRGRQSADAQGDVADAHLPAGHCGLRRDAGLQLRPRHGRLCLGGAAAHCPAAARAFPLTSPSRRIDPPRSTM